MKKKNHVVCGEMLFKWLKGNRAYYTVTLLTLTKQIVDVIWYDWMIKKNVCF